MRFLAELWRESDRGWRVVWTLFGIGFALQGVAIVAMTIDALK